jgi:hypothetical protein
MTRATAISSFALRVNIGASRVGHGVVGGREQIEVLSMPVLLIGDGLVLGGGSGRYYGRGFSLVFRRQLLLLNLILIPGHLDRWVLLCLFIVDIS